MYTLKKPRTPYLDDRQLYDYIMSIQELLVSLEKHLGDIDTRIKRLEAIHA